MLYVFSTSFEKNEINSLEGGLTEKKQKNLSEFCINSYAA
jgi:hypothetical protein